VRVLAFGWKDSAHPAAGGSEVYLHELARTWVAQGHEVDLFCGRAAGQAPTDLIDGVRVIRRGGRYGVYGEARRFYRREGRGRYDVVLDVVNTRPFLCPRFVDDVPVVALIHQVTREIWSYEFRFPAAILGRYVLEPHWLRTYGDVPTLTISSSSADCLRACGLRNVSVVPIGTTSSARTAPAPREARPTIVFVGRLARNKRPDHAIEAFRAVSEIVPAAQLWVVGAGPMEDTLRRTAPPGVTFFGRADGPTKDDLIARADVLVATSVREGWGLVVNEAAAAGTFVIGYDVAGLRDSVAMAGGSLCHPSPDALARELVTVLQEGRRPALSPPGEGPPGWAEAAGEVLRHLEGALSGV